MEVRIFGIDPGLENTGFAELEGDTTTGGIRVADGVFGVLKTVKWADKERKIAFDNRERADWIGQELMRIIAVQEPTDIAIEDFVYMGKRGGAESQMPMLVEHLRLMGKQMGCQVTIYANGDWKTRTLRCRTANKAQVQHYVKSMLPGVEKQIGNQPDHVWDAIGIAYCRWVETMYGRGKMKNDTGSRRGAIGRSRIGRR